MPIVNSNTKAQTPVAANAVAASQERESMRDDSRKKRVSRSSSNSEPSALPKFSNLVARELSSRLASEVQDHEEEDREEDSSESNESAREENSEKS